MCMCGTETAAEEPWVLGLNLYTSTHFLMLEGGGGGGGCCWEVKRLARPRSTRMLLAQTSFLAIKQSLFSLAPSAAT